MKPLFANPEDQAFFEENGYLRTKFLNDDDVKDLVDYYSQLDNNHVGEYGFHVSMDNRDYDFVKGVIDKLEAVVFSKAKSIFAPCQMFTASYVVKEPRMNSFVPPHQDWSFTDDKEFNSVTVWTALMDTDINNGAMAVLPGSHKWFTGPRASPSPGYITPFQAYGMDLFPYMKLIPMKAGETLIFENKTLHASPPNNSNAPRIGVGIGVSQAEAPLLHYYVIPGSEPQVLQSYHVDREFFFKYNNRKLLELQKENRFPEGYEKGDRVVNNPKVLSKEELEQKAIAAGFSKDSALDQYLQNFYRYMAELNSQNNQNGQSDSSNNISIGTRIRHLFGKILGKA